MHVTSHWVYLSSMHAIQPTDTSVQLRKVMKPGRFPGEMVDPLQRAEEETKRLAIDLSPEVVSFLERYAAYRNAMNEVSKRSVRQQWSRKSAGEALLTTMVAQVRASMADVFAELGEIPDAEDQKALEAYALKVLARADKSASKKSR